MFIFELILFWNYNALILNSHVFINEFIMILFLFKLILALFPS